MNLRWANVDFTAKEVRLGAAETKNRRPRVFPMTQELSAPLEAQRAVTKQRERATGAIIPLVFWRAEGDATLPVRDFRSA